MTSANLTAQPSTPRAPENQQLDVAAPTREQVKDLFEWLGDRENELGDLWVHLHISNDAITDAYLAHLADKDQQ